MSDDSERWPLSVYDIPHIRPLESDTPDECPICREPFNEEPIEEPVKINPLRCRHVFGHLCLAAHLYSDMPWSHTCPAYREVWYEPESAESYQTLGDEVAELRQLLQLWNNANVLNWALVTHLATQVRDNRSSSSGDRWLEGAAENRRDGEADAGDATLDQGEEEHVGEEDHWEVDDDWGC